MMKKFRLVLITAIQFIFLMGITLSQTQSNIQVTKLKEHFYRLTSTIPFPSNFLAYVTPEGILLVDSGQKETGNELKEVLKKIAIGNPEVKVLINTHIHIDHTGGNLFLAGVPLIVGPEVLRQAFHKYQYVLYDFPENSIPNVTFEDSVNIYFGGEKIRIITTPGAHSATDVIVHFTKSGIVCMGDISYGMTFPSFDGYTGNLNKYPEVIDRILTLIPDDVTIVSGHGREVSVKELKQFADMISNTSRIVREGVMNGKNIATMQKEDILKDWSSYEGGIAGDRNDWIMALTMAGPSLFRGSVPEELHNVLIKSDADAAIARYYELKKNYPNQYYFAERPIIRTGNWLLHKERVKDAIKLFELCVKEYPNSPQGYESLGRVYKETGNTELAIKNYEKLLQIDPGNADAKTALKSLKNKQ